MAVGRRSEPAGATARINLALQGGGAHGAFSWGVLDRLLDEKGVEVAAISGTSAGAMNAAAFKAGMIAGGREGARENLDWLWGQVTALSDLRLGRLGASLADSNLLRRGHGGLNRRIGLRDSCACFLHGALGDADILLGLADRGNTGIERRLSSVGR